MNSLANSYFDLGRHADALKLAEETLALRKAKLGPDHPDTLGAMNNLANCYDALGRHADALKLHEETLTLMKAKLGPDHPLTLASMSNLAISYFALDRHADALKLHEETLALRSQARPRSPRHVHEHVWRGRMPRKARSWCGGCADHRRLRPPGRAKAADPGLIEAAIDFRLWLFAKAKDGAGCRVTAEMWEKLKRTDAGSLYNAACFRAVTAGVLRAGGRAAASVKDAAAESDRAMSWLKQAVAAGYNDVAHMAKDDDLDPVRDREDFQKLIAELQARHDKDKK